VRQIDRVEHLADPQASVAAVVRREQLKVLASGQVRVELRGLDEPGDAFERPPAHADRVATEEPGVARRRPDQAEEHPKRRRLAGPVRTQVAVDVTGVDREVDAVNRGEVAVPLDEAARLDRPFRGGSRRHQPSARAAASAAAAGSDPTSVYRTPPRSNWIAVPSAVASSWPAAPLTDTRGSEPSGPAWCASAGCSRTTIAPRP